MPVTEKAFAQLSKVAGKLESTKYRSLYEAISKTKEEYTFYVAPQLSNYLDMEMYFEKNVRLELSRAKEEYKEALQNNEHPDKEAYIEEAYQNIMNAMQ